MIQQKIKILIVEDNTADAILIERQIKKIAVSPQIIHVKKFHALKESIVNFDPDIILCDYQLNEFTGLDVLKYTNNLPKYIPLIFVTGTINDEELAAASILTGATGYMLKKNINSLHKKLIPYFEEIIEYNSDKVVTPEHKMIYHELQRYLKGVKAENAMIRESYLEMKRALDKIKSLNK